MQEHYQQQYSANHLLNGELVLDGLFEACEFRGLSLEGKRLAGLRFEDCTFYDCNLSGCDTHQTAFRNCTFSGCKLLGFRFDRCNPLGLSFTFERCLLDRSVFAGLTLTGLHFNRCSVQEVDFVNAKLKNAHFTDCDLQGSLFADTLLDGADFTTAFNYRLKPEENSLNKTRFSADGLAGLLAHHGLVIG